MIYSRISTGYIIPLKRLTNEEKAIFKFSKNKIEKHYEEDFQEKANGNKISQKFRAYDSMDDYVKDEIQFLTNLYDFNQDDDFDTFISKLQGNNSGKRKYAEDKNYALKVRSVYNNI